MSMVEKPQSRNPNQTERGINKLDRKTPLQILRYEREVAAAFPRLGTGWQKEIAKKYEKFSKKADIKDIFSIAKKYDRKDVPQSMIAVALLDYADSVHEDLSAANFDVFLKSQWEEFKKLQKLQKEFEVHKTDRDFTDYKTFVAKSNVKQPVSIQQIRQSKGYSRNAFLFSQYLEKSFARSENKEVILGKLSQESKVAFVEYTESNTRLASIVQLPTDFVNTIKGDNLITNEKAAISGETTEKKSFSEVDDVFSRDFSREDGPKKILEDVDQSIFGNTWLSDSDLGMFRDILKDMPLDNWAFFLDQYPDETLPIGITADVMKQYLDNESVPKGVSKESIEECFSKIVMAYFVENTKKRMQEIVLKEYFSQVAGLLQVGGNHLHLVENQPITYEKDGAITMKYETTTGLQGNIRIGTDGVLSVETALGYDPQQGMNFNIQPTQKSLEGSLVSMTTMMQRVAKNKNIFFQQRKKNLEKTPVGVDEKKNNPTDSRDRVQIIQEMLTPEDEIARKNIEEPLKKELLMMQCTDRIVAFLQHTAKIQGVDPQQDTFFQYIQQTKGETGNIKPLSFSQNPMLQPFFLLREKIMKTPASQAVDILNGLERLHDMYTNNTFKKENYPFMMDGMLKESNDDASNEMGRGKKTLRSFLSFFCVGKTNVMQFDTALFQRTIFHMQQAKNDVKMLGELQPSKFLIPLDSLYYRNNPELAKQTAEIVGATTREITTLRGDILDTDIYG